MKKSGVIADLHAAINSLNLNNGIDLFCKTQQKVKVEKKYVFLYSHYITASFSMSHWNTSTPGLTNRACNIKTDKILLKNPYRQKSSTFRGGRIEMINAAKSPGKIMYYLKWNWAASQLFPFCLERKCVSAYLFHTLRTVTIILQFRHFKIFSHAVVRREKVWHCFQMMEEQEETWVSVYKFQN